MNLSKISYGFVIANNPEATDLHHVEGTSSDSFIDFVASSISSHIFRKPHYVGESVSIIMTGFFTNDIEPWVYHTYVAINSRFDMIMKFCYWLPHLLNIIFNTFKTKMRAPFLYRFYSVRGATFIFSNGITYTPFRPRQCKEIFTENRLVFAHTSYVI